MTRRFINSFKRAFNNPGRALGTLAIVALIVVTYVGPLLMQYREPAQPNFPVQLLPPLEIVASILTLMVSGYLFISFIIGFDYTRAFTEQDVLNVFPTPLPRTLVFQFFLFTRALLASVLAIVVIAYFFFRTSRSLLLAIPSHGETGSAALGSMVFTALFIAANSALLLGGVLCGLSAFRKIISRKLVWTLIAFVPVTFFGGLVYRTLSGNDTGTQFLAMLIRHTHDQPFASILLPSRAIADSALVSLGGWTVAVPIGIAVWGGLLLWSQRTLVRFAPTMYEYAVYLAQENARRKEQLKSRSFNVKAWTGQRRGKELAGLNRWSWIERWAPVGAMALFWRNVVMMRRSSIMLAIKLNISLMIIFSAGIAALRLWKPGLEEGELFALGGIVQFLVISLFATVSVGWLTETLKRFEIQKPLPIAPRHAVLAELLPTAVIVSCLSLFGIILLITLFPHQAGLFFLGFVTISSSYLLMSCFLFIVLLFNPDQHDTLQRTLFGIYTMIAFIFGFLPSGIMIALGFFLHFHLIVQGMMVIFVNGVCIAVLVMLAAKKYESFNPVE